MMAKGGLDVNDSMPAFTLPAADGSIIDSKKLKKKLQLIVFTCNHCPYAKAAWPKLVEIEKKFRKDVDVVAINSNDAELFPDDSFEAMQEFAKKNRLAFPYLYDEPQDAARAFHAKCTPDLYVFKAGKLVYRGRIDDNLEAPYSATKHELEEALKNLLSKGKVGFAPQPSGGCSIKWKE